MQPMAFTFEPAGHPLLKGRRSCLNSGDELLQSLYVFVTFWGFSKHGLYFIKQLLSLFNLLGRSCCQQPACTFKQVEILRQMCAYTTIE